jgi:hypothetical protein
MKLSATLCVSFVALAGFVYVTNGALAEPPDPCKTGCKTSHGHATSYLNPQPLPPGVKGPGHGGNTSNYVTPGRKRATGGAGAGKVRFNMIDANAPQSSS